MANQLELDKAYIKMAYVWASLSKAKRKQVGCLIVKGGAIISDGFNGTPKGFGNQCERQVPYFSWKQEETKPEVLHAESNAITKLAKSTQSSIGATIYTTASPCINCSKLIIQSDIARVVYDELYKNKDGVELLKKAGVEVECLNA